MSTDCGIRFQRKFGIVIRFIFYTYQLGHVYFFFETMIPALFALYSVPLALIWALVGVYLIYCTWSYYALCFIKGPGFLSDLLEKNEVLAAPERILKRAPRNSSQTIRELFDQTNKPLHLLTDPGYCKECKAIKPLRTHHCRVCNKCVLHMDHHCMWIGTCIGWNNLRFFLKLNVIGAIGSFYSSATLTLCSPHGLYKYYPWLFDTVGYIDLAIGKLITALAGCNLYLAAHGMTYLEFLSIFSKRSTEEETTRRYYGYIDWRDNFYKIFGSFGVFSSLFLSGMNQELELNGTEWAHLVQGDPGLFAINPRKRN